MTLGNRISLIWRFGKAHMLIGAVYNLFCAGLLAQGISYAFFVDSFILKAFLTAIALYLEKQFRDRDAIFFYINLGLSRLKLQVAVVVADFLALAILLTSVLLIYG